MNQLYRAALMPKKRLIKKIFGRKEIYAVCIRKVKNCNLLNSEKNMTFKEIFRKEHFWYADPISQEYQGIKALFMEQYDMNMKKGMIVCSTIEGDDSFSEPEVIINENFHMSFPMTFLWNNVVYMIPETSLDKSIRLYKAKKFPNQWILLERFSVDFPLVDHVVLQIEKNKISVLASEINPSNHLQVRFVKYYILLTEGKYQIIFDEKYNKKQKFNYKDRNAGRIIFTENGGILPVQVSTNIDYGVYLDFRQIENGFNHFSDSIKTVFPNQILVKGISSNAMIGIHSYDRIGDFEIIDLRYLT